MAMRILVGVLGGALVALMLSEIFLVFLLPRRVKRDPRIVRAVFALGWRPWRRMARRLPPRAADTMLGIYGPLGLLLNLTLWVAGLIVGYALLQWGLHSDLHPVHPVGFGDDLFFSAASLVSSGTGTLSAQDTAARLVQVIDAASGLAVLTLVIGYLPALFQAFSQREATVSQLDARAGSPPTAGRLVVRSTQRGGWPALSDYLREWETWVAELMETHLAYPVLAFFRSQHINQSWLAALCTVLDSCALTVCAAPVGSVDPARFTFAIARHAVVDLCYSFRGQPGSPADRLSEDELERLLAELREGGVEMGAAPKEIRARLTHMRGLYEPYVQALSVVLELPLPPWLAPESTSDNWRTTEWH
ncbi:MAG TPA: hypothetical protein VNV37_05825 [Solirubrobacteraceae bacterium]|jgi:hypothetical protein|nr:hypothetical protein [Solirubrobacteraceae bacterium]